MNGVLLKRRTCGREDAIGILLLLHLAHRAVRKYFVDGSCESILSSCAGRMKTTYAVSEIDYDPDICYIEPSFGALLRILEYVRVEMCTTFGDKAVGEQLAACIAQLAANRQLLPDETLTLGAAPRH